MSLSYREMTSFRRQLALLVGTITTEGPANPVVKPMMDPLEPGGIKADSGQKFAAAKLRM